MKLRALDMTLAGMFAALMAIGANITSWIPFLSIGGVPLTMQTFFCILAGALLGSRLAAVSMTVYLLIGLAGVPVFAGFSSGFDTIISPTFGFIVSFIFAAFFTGLIIERVKQPSLLTFIIATLVGLALNYVIGTNWMYFAYQLWAPLPKGVELVSYTVAWSWMTLFLAKDLAFTIFAAVIAPRIYKALQKSNMLTKTTAA
ncbi:biotin transporter BioY [Bacillus sp. HMF5848]|uniref:biotin transporter BioY n=1 Tax=Bacillus sp. HMF5848 TaxID=2495421 RepID=UPI000F787AB7|nr:biotin transporter BioY [Bacillus sp. HMF5848]RSK28418.1 biotin transporter BioY [Bacillus sp. HMF5848]